MSSFVINEYAILDGLDSGWVCCNFLNAVKHKTSLNDFLLAPVQVTSSFHQIPPIKFLELAHVENSLKMSLDKNKK